MRARGRGGGSSGRTPTPPPTTATAAPKVTGRRLPARARCGAPPTRQVTARGPPCAPGRHTPLLTQCPACGRGRAQAEEVGFGKPNLNQSGTKASAGRLPGAGGQRARREGESPGIVRQLCPGPRCEGNSAALSGSGHTAHYHTAGLVNWAGLGTRSGGQGCGHSPAVPQAGPSGQGPSHRWPCGQPAKPVAFPEPKQPPGFSGDADKSAGLGRETAQAPHRDQRSLRPRGPAPPATALAHRRALPEAASKLWLCQPGSSTPARIALQKKGGARRGGARRCRRPPGPVGTRGGMFLPLPPAQRVPPSAPRRAECRAQPGGGCCEPGQQETAPAPPWPPGPGFILGTNEHKGGARVCRPDAMCTRGLGVPPGVPTLSW